MNDLPEITVLTPVYQRPEFLSVYLSNICAQDYPKDKIKVLIHECKSDRPFIQDIDLIKQNIAPIQIRHHVDNSGRKTIGEKRNWLVKNCKTDYFMFFDSDDVYLPTALNHSVQGLINSKRSFAGSTQMIFCYPLHDFATRVINCGDEKKMIHEATICSTTSFFKKHKLKFKNTSQGEFQGMLDNVKNEDVLLTNICYLMLCLCHPNNSVDKSMFLVDEYAVEVEFDENLKNGIIAIFK